MYVNIILIMHLNTQYTPPHTPHIIKVFTSHNILFHSCRSTKCGHPAHLFIDSVEFIVKYQPKLYASLIDHAKVCARPKEVTIILVSNEAKVMRFLKRIPTCKALIHKIGG